VIMHGRKASKAGMMERVSKFNPDATLVDLKLATLRWHETEGEDRMAIKQMLFTVAERTSGTR
jgi:hypothetical protein